MYIYNKGESIYKKQFGKTLENSSLENLIKPVIDDSLSGKIKEFAYKDFYKFKFSYILEMDLLFLFVNSVADPINKIKKELKRYKEEFLEILNDSPLDQIDTKHLDQIEILTYSVQNKFPPIISLVGYSTVGKTTIIDQLKTKGFVKEQNPTISGDTEILKIGRLYFELKDFNGDEKIGFLWNNFLRGSDCVLIVTDSTPKNIGNSKFFLGKIEEEVPYAYTAIIANKQDLRDAEKPLKIQEILGFKSYPMIASDSKNREKLIYIVLEILEMKEDCYSLLYLLIERDKLFLKLEQTIKNEEYEDLDSIFEKLIEISLKLGDNIDHYYNMQLKLKGGIGKFESPTLITNSKTQITEQTSQVKGISHLESRLKLLLKNYMTDIESVIAVTICDREGLIITSESRGETEDEVVLGAIAASVDSYIDRIRGEFEDDTNFFNITTIRDKRFAYCSMGINSILLTISNLTGSDTELRVYSEHIAGKVNMLLDGNENVSLTIPDILKFLSKTKDGKIPTGEFPLKLIISGDYEVGKTSLINRFVKNLFKEAYHSTIGVEISKKSIELSTETIIDFAIWDIGGQITQMTPYRKRFYTGAHSAFIVIDRTRKGSLQSIEKWSTEFQKYVERKINVIIVGNKSDLDEKIVISEKDIKRIAEKNNFHYILTSAKTGENAYDAFLYIAYRFLESVS